MHQSSRQHRATNMSKRSPIIVLCVAFCFLSSYRDSGGIRCCHGSPLHSILSSSAANPSEVGSDVNLLPSVIWPWVASAKHLAITFDSHFIFTFDGRLYRLPNCRHTLMRDRGESDRVSTLIGNLHSLTIIARQLTVSIDENYQVKVNNTNIIRDLPLTSWDRRILVSREGSWISVESLDGGYMTTCSPLAKICIVILSTSYEGHSVGLLGTNDGNSSNDFLLRNGKESDNMRNFINSYEVTGMTHCLSSGAEDNATGRRYLAQNADEEEEEGADEGETQEQDEEDEQRTCEKRYIFACRDLFRSQRSTMAKCYSKIDPVPFLNACLDLMDVCNRPQRRGVTNVTDAGFCSLAFSYSLLCNLSPSDSHSSNASSSIHRHNNGSQSLVTIPSSCRACSASTTDTMQSLQPTREKVEVVVVVYGLKSSNTTGAYRIGQTLKHLLHEMRESLRTNHSIHDLRIGLVTYDDRTRPVSHTMKGLLFGTSHSHSSLESRLINLDTNPGSTSFPAEASESSHTRYTTTDALRLALKYPMRALAVKQLLLVTTSTVQMGTDDLEQISRESIGRGIQLNLWSLSGVQNNSSSLNRLVASTRGSVFHVTRSTRQHSGATIRQISRRLIQQIVSRMRLCQRCSIICSPLGILDDLHCQPVQDGPC